MKTLFSILFGLASFASVTQARTPTADEATIRKVIADETDAFFAKNREKWASHRAHESYISWTAQGRAASVLRQSGWDAASTLFGGYFTNVEPGPAMTFLPEHCQVTALDKIATVSFLQTQQRANGDLKSREVGVLEKRDFVVTPAQLLPDTPADLVQRQLNAYNARDIEGFLEPYAEDVELYDLPEKLIGRGKDAMRKQYAGMFARLPALHCELVNRMVVGNTVVDHERITFVADKAPTEAIAIYKIENGKIRKVYFTR